MMEQIEKTIEQRKEEEIKLKETEERIEIGNDMEEEE